MGEYTLNDFWLRKSETKFNQGILNGDISLNEYKEYIDYICSISISDILDFIKKTYEPKPLRPADIFQISDFDKATFEICKVLDIFSQVGYRYTDIGKLLENDGIPRKDTAFQKYGENQVKFAELLGITFKKDKYFYFISCIGIAMRYINEKERANLILRLVLRTNIFQKLYFESFNGPIKIEYLMHEISNKTYRRRVQSLKQVFSFVLKSEEYDFSDFYNSLIF